MQDQWTISVHLLIGDVLGYGNTPLYCMLEIYFTVRLHFTHVTINALNKSTVELAPDLTRGTGIYALGKLLDIELKRQAILSLPI